MTQEIVNKITEAFDVNPHADQFFVTSDGHCFVGVSYARLYARSLADEKIVPVQRGEENRLVDGYTEAPELSEAESLLLSFQSKTVKDLVAILKDEYGVQEDALKGKKKPELLEMVGNYLFPADAPEVEADPESDPETEENPSGTPEEETDTKNS